MIPSSVRKTNRMLGVVGRRVAVIGTGATAMQLVPAISEGVAQLTVYQRTPQWSRLIPGHADRIPAVAAGLPEHVPFYEKYFRFNMFWRYGDGFLPFLRRAPDWPYSDRSVNRINDRHRQEMTYFLRAELSERADQRPGCLPDSPPHGKRILLDNCWYRNRHNRLFWVIPWRFVDYRARTHDPDPDEFDLLSPTGS